jgi:hypothetical protein
VKIFVKKKNYERKKFYTKKNILKNFMKNTPAWIHEIYVKDNLLRKRKYCKKINFWAEKINSREKKFYAKKIYSVNKLWTPRAIKKFMWKKKFSAKKQNLGTKNKNILAQFFVTRICKKKIHTLSDRMSRPLNHLYRTLKR